MKKQSTFRVSLFVLVSVLSLSLISSNALADAKNEDDISSTNGKDSDNVEKIDITYRQLFRGNVKPFELPQAITTITGDDAKKLGMTRLQDVLTLDASLTKQNNSGGFWDSFAIRGFAGNENMPAGFMVNGFSGGRGFSGTFDMSNVESIEVIKGPGSALYGRSEPGGVVNIITKKPQYYESGSISAIYGSFANQRIEADYTQGINDILAVRINGAFEDNNSYRDTVTRRKTVLSPSFNIDLGDAESLLYEMQFFKQAQRFDRGIAILNDNFDDIDTSLYLGEPNDGPTTIYALSHQLTYDRQLNSQWALLAGLSYRDTRMDGFSSDAELSGARQSVYDDGETLTRQRRKRDYDSSDSALRVELSGDTQFAGLSHNLLVGIDAYEYDLSTALFRYRGGKGTYTLNINNPVYGQQQPDVALLYQNIEEQRGVGLYVQDTIAVANNIDILLGARADYIDQDIFEVNQQTTNRDTETRLSPRLGLIYKVSDNINVYTSYSEGFLSLSGTDANGEPFGFEESSSVEIGSKFSFNNIVGSVAAFRGRKSNILVADPVNVGISAPLGEAVSKGVEIEFNAQISDNMSLFVSAAKTQAETENTVVNADWGVEIPQGSPLVNVPEYTLSTVLTYFTKIAGMDSQIGSSYQYVHEQLGDAADLSFQLPSYQLAGLFATLAFTDSLNLQLNVDNLFDETYIESSYHRLWSYPGAPRTINMQVDYAF